MGSVSEEGSEKKAMWLYPKAMGFNPSERWGHSASFSNGILYIFGGCCGGLHFSDVLLLNLETMIWTALAPSGEGPGPRDSHSTVIVDRRMLVFGGTTGAKKVNDLHVLDLTSNAWMLPKCSGTPPSPRESHTATLVGCERLAVFGGSGEGEGNYLNDVHFLNLRTMTWTSPQVSGEVPVPRDSHSAVVVGNRLFVYGGDCGDRYSSDVNVLDLDTMTWSRLSVQGSLPGPRAGHAAVNLGTKVYVIGGVGEKRYYSDVWVLDVSTCSWTQLDVGGQPPQGRFSHTAIVTDLDIAIYGGCGEDERPLNELLVLQLGAKHPRGRYNISMCKIFGRHCTQDKRAHQAKTTLLGSNGKTNQPFLHHSDTLHPKRRRTSTASVRACNVESEQEEHSLSVSQNSSPSLSDQEQTTHKASESSPSGSRGLNLFNRLSDSDPNKQQAAKNLHISGDRHSQPRPFDSVALHNVIGADVRGKVDGVFDSGYLMTATVNGKLFRGVLFAPGLGPVPRAPVLVQNAAPIGASMQPLASPGYVEPRSRLFRPRPRHSFPVARPVTISRSSPLPIPRDPSLRSELHNVVLTLGGPGSS